MIFYFFTFLVILLCERATEIASKRVFRGYICEIEREEEKLFELEELSILALVMGEKDAYRGFQQMMSEIYGKVFFRRLAFFTPLFFLILSPYLVFVELSGIGSSSTVVAIAILYFSFRLIAGFIRQNYELWRTQRELSQKISADQGSP